MKIDLRPRGTKGFHAEFGEDERILDKVRYAARVSPSWKTALEIVEAGAAGAIVAEGGEQVGVVALEHMPWFAWAQKERADNKEMRISLDLAEATSALAQWERLMQKDVRFARFRDAHLVEMNLAYYEWPWIDSVLWDGEVIVATSNRWGRMWVWKNGEKVEIWNYEVLGGRGYWPNWWAVKEITHEFFGGGRIEDAAVVWALKGLKR